MYYRNVLAQVGQLLIGLIGLLTCWTISRVVRASYPKEVKKLSSRNEHEIFVCQSNTSGHALENFNMPLAVK